MRSESRIRVSVVESAEQFTREETVPHTKFCKSKFSKSVHGLDEYSSCESDGENYFVGAVNRKTEIKENACFSSFKLEGKTVQFKIDTGAQVNILPLSIYKKLSNVKLSKTSTSLTSYSGDKLKVVGKCSLHLKDKNCEFFVTDTNQSPLLGFKASHELGLIHVIMTVQTDVDDPVKSFPKVFTGLGCLEKPYHIKIDSSVNPVINPPRKIPAALREKLKGTLKEKEDKEVIRKVDEPTDWVNSLVVVEKPKTGKLRICLDPRNLYKAIKREHFALPTIEDITTRLTGAKYLSKLDCNNGYWQLRMDKESQLLTTFNSPFGRCQEVGLTLNAEKCKFRVKEVTYIGHTLSVDGVRPDQENIRAIKEMPAPTDKKGVQRLLGTINYLAKFVPNMSAVTEPIRKLLKEEHEFIWTHEQQQAFEKLKDIITKNPVLSFYDVSKPVTVSCDASQCGLGAMLIQDNKPVAYASRSLTDAESRYANIERELLGVLFGLERFNDYTYGKHINVESDHKPLEMIVRKSLGCAPPRLQRMLLRRKDNYSNEYEKEYAQQTTRRTFGNRKTRKLARDSIFWPGINAQITDFISKCSVCLESRRSNTKEPMAESETPELPWMTVGTDIFYWNNNNYLIIVDYYSRYFEIAKLENIRAPCVITHMKSVFARHGIPSKVRSDSGSQYVSAEFRQFAESWDSHTVSSPHYQQSNGLAERFVQSVKKMLSKSKQDGKDPYIAMDKSSKPLPELQPNDTTRFQHNPKGKWDQGTVVRNNNTPNSYVIETPEGQIFKRNRKHLLKTKEDKIEQTSLEEANENNHNDFDNITDEHSLEPSFVRRSERSVKKPTRLIEEC
ncbi:unnamed protein product [Mytilus coruscus]|uniref:Integrase catalytic domain-containing protein n=1 Tax=Mytilus coruscus TaxID=42192 RepID=A0A6J8CCK2_MYTCO|nr:unnamed protein product [Mytilus coruscus]